MHELTGKMFLLMSSTLTGTLPLITSQQKNSTLGGASPHQTAFQILDYEREETCRKNWQNKNHCKNHSK